MAVSGCVALMVNAAGAQTYTSSGNSVLVPDNNATGATLDIVVSDYGILTDLNVGLLITHTWQGDVAATIQHVDTGTTATIVNRPGSPLSLNGYSADNFGNIGTATNFVLDDAAAAVYDRPPLGGGPNDAVGTANVVGSWKPDGTPNDEPEGVGSLAVFNGQNIHGTWRLKVIDHAGADTGAIRTLRLAFSSYFGCGNPGNGSCYEPHGGLGCNNAACCAAVCALDPFCCDTSWDGICAGEAADICASCGNPNSGSCFEPHASAYCDDPTCCETVCGLDPYCCEFEWDNICVAEASALCGLTPPVNDECAGSIALTNQPVAFSTIGATTNGPQHPGCLPVGSGADVWFTYNATFSGTATIRTGGAVVWAVVV
jgi:hypothetical protein